MNRMMQIGVATLSAVVVSSGLCAGEKSYIDLDTLRLHRSKAPVQASQANHSGVTGELTPKQWLKTRTRGYKRPWHRMKGAPFDAPIGKPFDRPKRGWILAYRYDKADFYDAYGFHYGRFDRFGFYFEGRSFRFNARYRYRDRIRGRGYFDGAYYMPAQARRYGFCVGFYPNLGYTFRQ